MKKIIFILSFLICANAFAADPQARRIAVNASAFSGNLSSDDTNVQKALETIDALDIGEGSGGGTECSSSACDLNEGTTLGGQDICLEDGTNCPAGSGGEEVDPIFTASDAFGISSTDISNWDDAYSWGDHGSEGYLTAEADTLQTVTTRGASSTNTITISPTGNNKGLIVNGSGSGGGVEIDHSGSGASLNILNGGSGNFIVVDTNKLVLSNAGNLTLTESITAKKVITAVVALTDGGTPALNAASGSVFTLSAEGNRTIGVPSNPSSGQKIVIAHTAVGANRTLALNTGTGGFRFGSDVTALTETESGKTDYIGAIYSATANKWDVIGYSKGYS